MEDDQCISKSMAFEIIVTSKAKQVERIKEAAEIWRLLKGTYSGVGNEMLACKIQKELQGQC